MTTVLQDLRHIRSTLVFDITVYKYREEPTDFPSEQILRFNDSIYPLVGSGGEEYPGLGPLVNLSSTRSEIRPSDNTFTISLSGIPQLAVKQILNSDIKGSQVLVRRVFFYPGTNTIISDLDFTSAGTAGRYFGYVSTYTIEDAVDRQTLTSSVILNLECNSYINIFNKITRGIRTNPKDLRYLTSDADTSFDRVPALKDSNFVFGAPK